jgi:hypothetical protein
VFGLWATGAGADVTTERSASILVFPKVVVDGSRETIIQITNTSNSMVHAHCFYVNGALTFPEQDPGPNNPPLWTEIDFDIWLTKQQPTHWVVGEGRLVDPSEEPCSNAENEFTCVNAGIDPGRVPPVVPDFTGELKCVEVEASGNPLSGNHLKGEATIVDENSGDVQKYNAIGVLGDETNDGDGVLCLGGPERDGCPDGAEYNACPQTWILNHLADFAVDPAIGTDVCEDGTCTVTETSCVSDDDCDGPSEVTSHITIVPCSQNFETQVPTAVTIQFAITNEYEQTFSASTTVTCWAELGLSEINEVFDVEAVGSTFAQTRMRSSTGTASGFMVVADEEHVGVSGDSATAAVNVHVEGQRSAGDIIVIPSDQLPEDEE